MWRIGSFFVNDLEYIYIVIRKPSLIVSVILNVLTFVFRPRVWLSQVSVPGLLEKNLCAAAVGSVL